MSLYFGKEKITKNKQITKNKRIQKKHLEIGLTLANPKFNFRQTLVKGL